MRAQHADRPPAVLAEGRHHQLAVDAVFKFHVDDLVVHHVVVAEVDTPAVGAFLNGLTDAGLVGMQGQNVAGPVVFAV